MGYPVFFGALVQSCVVEISVAVKNHEKLYMALIIEIKVIPQSGRFGLELDKNGTLKCFLKSAPEKGAANKELIKGLSKKLKIPQNDIEIIAGLTVRNKKIKIHQALTLEQFYDKVGLSYQQKLIS